MLHYALQPATGLLFLAITHPDMPQSAAFGFLNTFKNVFANQKDFSHLMRTKDDAELEAQAKPVLRAVIHNHNRDFGPSLVLSAGAAALHKEGMGLGLGDRPQAAPTVGGKGAGGGEG